jgi:hypothetical protein
MLNTPATYTSSYHRIKYDATESKIYVSFNILSAAYSNLERACLVKMDTDLIKEWYTCIETGSTTNIYAVILDFTFTSTDLWQYWYYFPSSGVHRYALVKSSKATGTANLMTRWSNTVPSFDPAMNSKLVLSANGTFWYACGI